MDEIEVTHGRCGQTGVYQQITAKEQESNWIILQPSKLSRTRLENLLRTRALDGHRPPGNPMILHVHFLTIMAGNWKEYIQDLYDQLKDLVSPQTTQHIL